MDNFEELRHRYINRTATKEETEEFLKLVASGQYDDFIISEGPREVLDPDPAQFSDDEQALYNARKKTYDFILQRNRIRTKKVIALTPKRRVWMAAAAVSLAVAAYFGVMTKHTAPSHQAIAQQKAPKPAVYSGKQVLNLPDGTQVILNDNSKLTYGQAFGARNREVTLTGEASFDVTHDPARPFIVHTGKVNTKVLGTAFNINAYPEQNQITVTVLRGLVEVGDDQHVYGEIRPDQQIAVNTNTYDYVRRDANAEEAVVWQSDFLVLDDVTLEEAAIRIGKKFHVKITFENPALKKCKFYGSFLNDENLTDILTMMGPVLHIEHKIENGHVIISGKGCD
jgi:ferric-dicitrate binding protein FerR (iron transport regulator)